MNKRRHHFRGLSPRRPRFYRVSYQCGTALQISHICVKGGEGKKGGALSASHEGVAAERGIWSHKQPGLNLALCMCEAVQKYQ